VALFLLPAFGARMGWRLPAIVLVLAASRALELVAYYCLAVRSFPGLRSLPSSWRPEVPQLASLGGWVVVSTVVSPILVYLDRFLIGSLVTMSAVAYYIAPYEVVARLWVFPGSLGATLFPAFSSLAPHDRAARLGFLLSRTFKWLLLGVGPVVAILVAFARDFLQLWLVAPIRPRKHPDPSDLDRGGASQFLRPGPLLPDSGSGPAGCDSQDSFRGVALSHFVDVDAGEALGHQRSCAGLVHTGHGGCGHPVLCGRQFAFGRCRRLVFDKAISAVLVLCAFAGGTVLIAGLRLAVGWRLLALAMALVPMRLTVWLYLFDDSDRLQLLRLLPIRSRK